MAKKDHSTQYLYDAVKRGVDKATRKADYTYDQLIRSVVKELTEQE